MSMLDSFFNKGFKAVKCKTLLKLTIPRIKLLRNRREIQIKQMRRDIAKLLETGQEATARIRVEHIIREEKMMAAQEIIELFCELIAVRLPIIEAQRECPLDLKEAISSVCFAAPRCADLPELLQVQMSFTGKYGKEFVTAATELMPECGVNRQLIELLSVRAPAPDVKMKLLKEIAEEHELDWDPTASEAELLKPHEDLLNGVTQFVSGSKLPFPEAKENKPVYASVEAPSEQSNLDAGFDSMEFPEVPKAPLPGSGTGSVPEMLPFPAAALAEDDDVLEEESYGDNENPAHELPLEPERVLHHKLVSEEVQSPNKSVGPNEVKQFLPFLVPPSVASTFPAKQRTPSPPKQRTPSPPKQRIPSPSSRSKSEDNVDLQDVIAAAHAAAETAERAAAAARSVASLALTKIKLVKKKNDGVSDKNENPFHPDSYLASAQGNPHLNHQDSLGDSADGSPCSPNLYNDHPNLLRSQLSNLPSYDEPKSVVSSPPNNHVTGRDSHHPPQKLTSINDESYFSYPNLFTSQSSNLGSGSDSFKKDNSPSSA